MVLLVVHGFASALWGPAEQMLLYDMVGPEDLGSAVRLQATGLNLGMLLGPLVGAALLFTVGPAAGMFINVAFYVPFIIYLWVMPFTGHTHRAGVPRPRLGLRATFGVLAEIPRYPSILLVFVLQGASGLFIGNALLPLLPEFGDLLGATGSGFGYGALIAAMSVGAVVAGFGVEALGRVRASVAFTALATLVLGGGLIVFALSRSLLLSVLMLVLAGAGSLLAATTAQTVVQLQAPEDRRGRFLGAFSMTSQGLRLGSGVLVGLFTGLVGPAGAIGIDAVALVAVALVLLVVVLARRDARGPVIAVEDEEPVADQVTS
jgi:MFS family permease